MMLLLFIISLNLRIKKFCLIFLKDNYIYRYIKEKITYFVQLDKLKTSEIINTGIHFYTIFEMLKNNQ